MANKKVVDSKNLKIVDPKVLEERKARPFVCVLGERISSWRVPRQLQSTPTKGSVAHLQKEAWRNWESTPTKRKRGATAKKKQGNTRSLKNVSLTSQRFVWASWGARWGGARWGDPQRQGAERGGGGAARRSARRWKASSDSEGGFGYRKRAGTSKASSDIEGDFGYRKPVGGDLQARRKQYNKERYQVKKKAAADAAAAEAKQKAEFAAKKRAEVLATPDHKLVLADLVWI